MVSKWGEKIGNQNEEKGEREKYKVAAVSSDFLASQANKFERQSDDILIADFKSADNSFRIANPKGQRPLYGNNN
ncbi:hypothetical protein D0T49_12420 [Paludibacter sp. 221]|uniref:hypothetical protein n=1 Tax=Paludibacter sp. 221 TaxID=2302939 RepID=UPI0013D641B3|nr:hypothetical protein [Paludibacter sp. 221]NDV47851.1 hypothetical protein [Paludibacter sp. 221]